LPSFVETGTETIDIPTLNFNYIGSYSRCESVTGMRP
jgi:hypothetical protein